MIHSVKKGGVGTLCQDAACSNELFSLMGRLCFGGKPFDSAKVNFCRLFHPRGRDTHIDFLPLLKCKMFKRVLGCLISPKCILDLNNSKLLSFCP